MRRKYFGLAMAAVATLGPAQAFGGDQEIAKEIIGRLKVSRDAGELKNFDLDMKVDEGVVLFRGKVNGPEQRAVVLATSKGIEGVQNVIDELKVGQSVALAESKPAKIYRPKAAKIETVAAEKPATRKASDGFDFASALATQTETAATASKAEKETTFVMPEAVNVAPPVVPAIVANAPVEVSPEEVSPEEVSPIEVSPAQASPEVSEVAQAAQPEAQLQPAQEVVPGLVLPTAAFEGEPKSAAVSDEQLTQSVVRAIGRAKAEGHVKNFGIDVNAYDGMIELEGKAASVQQREFLAKIASHAPGARGVRNLIEVVQSAPKPAKSIVAQPAAHRTVSNHGLQPLPQGNQPQMAALPQSHQMQRGVPAHMAAYGQQGGQQMINGEMVVPGSMVTHGGGGASYGMGSPMGGQVSGAPMMGTPVPMAPSAPAGAPRYDSPNLPNYAWPGYAAYPNYAALSYPQQYSPSAFPYIGPFYPYPQVPMGWRKVSLEWDDGWWFLDFTDK